MRWWRRWPPCRRASCWRRASRPCNGRSPIGWSLLGQQGFPVITVPAGFTTEVWDRERDGAETRLVGPIPARLPVGVDFIARPFDEPLLFRIASRLRGGDQAPHAAARLRAAGGGTVGG